MWGSSSGYVGSNNLSSNDSGSITNIAQYIEDYIDLVENIPNEISRNISRLHEYNNRYYQLLDQLEKYWATLASGQCYLTNGGVAAVDRVVNGESDNNVTSSLTTISTNLGKTASTITTTATKNSKCNHPQENGTKSDKKNGNGSGTRNGAKQAFDQKKGLRAVYHIQKCLIEIQEIADEKLFIVQSILDQLDAKARQLDFDYRNVTQGTLANNLNSNSSKSLSSSAANSDSTNHITDLNGVAYNSDITAAGNGGSISGKGGDITSTKDNSSVNTNGTSLGATVNNCTTTSTSTPTTNSSSLSNKRSSSRRNLSSNKQEISNGETTNHKRGVKRGVKGSGKEIKRSKSNKDLLNTSPPTLYEDTPIDPDEPTYCSCEQVSYGEMICCDNAQCQIEWFHFACVSLTTKPKGKWYCPNCRGDRSNIPKK